MTQVTPTPPGFEVDAGLIAAAFGLDAAQVRDMMRAGKITSRCETGVDSDAGRWRLTFFHRSRAFRLTVDAGGSVLLRATFDAPRRAFRADSEPEVMPNTILDVAPR